MMNFKADWSFLEKVSMGASASKAVIEILNNAGHDVIELERYSTRNKIWATKIKRLRMPDLICLKCGKRIESRAKSKLDVRMSDNENNADRRWDAGLRDEDLIAFIQCQKCDDEWVPAEELNLFTAKSLRMTVGDSKLGPAKSAGEGAERDRIWKTTIPKKDGYVVEVATDVSQKKIKVQYDDAKTYTYSVGYNVYSNPLDRFIAYSTMIAGVPTKKEKISACSSTQYDFVADLSNAKVEVRYAGVKALGHLAPTKRAIDGLKDLLTTEEDTRIKLEIYSSLIRLGVDLWKEFYDYAMSIESQQYRFEYVLIMGELNSYTKANETLLNIANDKLVDSEMRAAAAWGIAVNASTISNILEIAKVDDAEVVAHTIAHLISDFDNTLIEPMIKAIDDDNVGAVVQKVITEVDQIDTNKVVETYIKQNNPLAIKWIAVAIGLSGKEKYKDYEVKLKAFNLKMYELIDSLWNYHEYMVDKNKSSEIEFLIKQTM